jgi:hypothetical protein
MSLLDLEATAKHFHRSPRQFRDDVKRLAIPHIRIGRRMLFDAARVELFLESLETTNKPERSSVKRSVKPVNKYAEALGL